MSLQNKVSSPVACIGAAVGIIVQQRANACAMSLTLMLRQYVAFMKRSLKHVSKRGEQPLGLVICGLQGHELILNLWMLPYDVSAPLAALILVSLILPDLAPHVRSARSASAQIRFSSSTR